MTSLSRPSSLLTRSIQSLSTMASPDPYYLRADPLEKLAALEAGSAPSLRPGSFKAPDRLLAMLKAN